MPATPVPKLTTTFFYLGKLIVQQSFQPPAYFVIFSDEFKFTYKTVCSHKPNILQWLLSHDAFKGFCFCGSNPSALLATMACAKGFQRISVPAVQARFLVLVPFRGKHQKRFGIHK
jgi:hypothetical protein